MHADQTAEAEGGSAIERFCERSREVGVPVARVSREEATDVIGELADPPVVATPLPWEGIDSPEDATTEPTPDDLERATTGVTPAVGAVADYGSVLLRSDRAGSEPTSLFVDRHIAVLDAADVVPDMGTTLADHGDAFREEGASIVVATGPSATADMGELVVGAHGPRGVDVVLIDDDADVGETIDGGSDE
ncbi:LUD domain-containing protein [Saliphagus sp. LR7]|uniref:LUD domain-containing protein n=1 Tax=Saliphagus sp. LR7 TaxID=2282654 RepID=UPI000DF832DD|nr:LUD domain-containing protein [Saliphagus sp. LR7]